MTNRRDFLFGVGAIGLTGLPPTVARACSTTTECVPDMPPGYTGTRTGTPPLDPTLCLSDELYDIMTLSRRNGRWVRGEAVWDYGLYYGRGIQPEVYPTLVRGRCYDRQRLWPGTRIINWTNCIDRETGQWVRYWSATPAIRDSGRYELVIYFREPARSYEDVPQVWRLPR